MLTATKRSSAPSAAAPSAARSCAAPASAKSQSPVRAASCAGPLAEPVNRCASGPPRATSGTAAASASASTAPTYSSNAVHSEGASTSRATIVVRRL